MEHTPEPRCNCTGECERGEECPYPPIYLTLSKVGIEVFLTPAIIQALLDDPEGLE